jgi:sigma-B regulation protein RsbU (phosphoserine phosphatase)
MAESDSAAVQRMRISEPEGKHMLGTTDSYIREQLENRRERLTAAIGSAPVAAPLARYRELLSEVDAALHRMDAGAYGICDVCHASIERDRLIEDPLVRVCLDHLSSEERRSLEGDLELAASIQRSLLPPPSVQSLGWQIEYEYQPAGLVSGDYCDVIVPAEGGPIFLVGDVSGKGVAASLLMSYLRATFRSLSSAGIEINKLLEAANRLFCESTMAGQFATLVCGRAGRGGDVEIASAGHCPALVVSSQGVSQVAATGLPLGMFSTSHYTVERIDLELGDTLLFYTDGISEARDADGNEYGVEGVSRFAGECHGRRPGQVSAACLKSVQTFSAGTRQADDQTVMAIRRTASDSPPPTR